MQSVDQIIHDIIRREGHYNDVAGDAGGPTNRGVSLRYARNVGLVWDLDHNGEVDANDIKLVTDDEASECFKRDFLMQPGIDRLPQDVVPQAFDFAVNAGPPRAIKTVQEVLVLAGFLPSLSAAGRPQDDGVLGRGTLSAAVAADKAMGKLFANALVDQRQIFYTNLADQNPSQEKFRKGWMARAEEFRV